ncbi:MAG: hypothetical protein KIT33_11595 [Candidatus Kapabacteria bacterium]|nr:hypothetical protein [Ignavibacteriota bacterium]MCW5885603.1 hypothetical protein [Candidatus Kapabacteria bacterium]
MPYYLNNIPTIRILIGILIVSTAMISIACGPTLYLPKQNLNEIEGEYKNSESDDIAPARVKNLDCPNCLQPESEISLDSVKVMPSAAYIDKLFIPEVAEDDELKELRRKREFDVSQYTMSKKPDAVNRIAAVRNLTANVESLYFISQSSGFASFSHPPSFEYLAANYLPFEKSIPKGGTDIFYFGKNQNGQIRFVELNQINSRFWDSHPTAVTKENSEGKLITLLIFSSDRDNPFSKAINLKGDTIYGGSTDLYYSFGEYDPTISIDTLSFEGFNWETPRPLRGANTTNFNEGSPFVYCQDFNPTLFFSSNRDNANIGDFDIYAAKLDINFDSKSISLLSVPELIDLKSPTADSLTYSINTPADERFPYVPFPHLEKAEDNPLYFSSDRNRKRIMKACDCEPGNDRTENIGGYDIYKYPLPEKYNCPKPEKPVIPKEPVYEPGLFAEIVVVNLEKPDEPVKNASLAIYDESGKLISDNYQDGKLKVKLDFEKNYLVKGGSSFNDMDCLSDKEIIFRGYKAPSETFYERNLDSSLKIDILTGYSMNSKEFITINQDITRQEKGMIIEKGIQVESDDVINEKIINARISGDIVAYDKQITITKYWNRIELRPALYSGDFAVESALSGAVRSVATMNEIYYREKPKSNEKIVIHDTVYLLPDYIIKPPCYCEFSGVLTSYQQNVPYFQTGFWEVNSLRNFRRDMRTLESFKFREARWIELHKDNQYFGEGMKGRLKRTYEYEDYARIVDSNLYKMADMISNKIIPAFRVIDSITPGSKLIISLDAWSDRRPVRRGWYIGDDVDYVEGTLIEDTRDYDIDFHRVMIQDKSSLNLNNDTLSRLRAYYGYLELLDKLLDTAIVGRGFYDYYVDGLTLLPDDDALQNANLNLPFSLKSVEELVFKSKIIILAKGNYFDPTEYKIPRYIRDIDSSLFMLDTIRRIDVRINTLEYKAGKLIKSPCCNDNLPCLDYRDIINFNNKILETKATDPRRRKRGN